IEDDEVRVLGTLGALHAFFRAQHIGDLVRVVLVHLAAERAQVEPRHQFSGLSASSGDRIQTRCTRPALSSWYFTTAAGGRLAGMMMRFIVSRICAPGES